MHAIRVHQPGGPEALRYEQIPDPSPGPGQALVRMEVIGVNFVDVYQRAGVYQADLPFTLGSWSSCPRASTAAWLPPPCCRA